MGFINRFAIGVLCFATAAQAAGPEVWLYRPQVLLKDTHSENKQAEKILSQDPRVVAADLVESLHVEGLRFEDGRLALRSLRGGLSIGRLTGDKEITVPVVNTKQKIAMFALRDIKVSLQSRGEITLDLPEKVLVDARVEGSKAAFSINVEDFKTQVASRIDSLLQDGAFDRLFTIQLSGSVPDLARDVLGKMIEAHKPELLKQARENLKNILIAEDLNKLFSLQSNLLPASVLETSTKWELIKVASANSVSWGLRAQSNQPARALSPQLGQQDVRNLVTVALPFDLVGSLAGKGLKQVSISAEASTAFSKLLGVTLAQGEKLSIVADGERAPRVKSWSRVENGKKLHYLDVLMTFQGDQGSQSSVGGIFEVGSKTLPWLTYLAAVRSGSSLMDADKYGLNSALTTNLVAGLLQSELSKATDNVSSATSLEMLGMRSLGDAGVRRAGQADQGNWGELLAIDFRKQ
ncbi:hypothetical protein K2X33_12005 [bacterium]|nr:hypothetical protein [bacterium]